MPATTYLSSSDSGYETTAGLLPKSFLKKLFMPESLNTPIFIKGKKNLSLSLEYNQTDHYFLLKTPETPNTGQSYTSQKQLINAIQKQLGSVLIIKYPKDAVKPHQYFLNQLKKKKRCYQLMKGHSLLIIAAYAPKQLALMVESIKGYSKTKQKVLQSLIYETNGHVTGLNVLAFYSESSLKQLLHIVKDHKDAGDKLAESLHKHGIDALTTLMTVAIYAPSCLEPLIQIVSNGYFTGYYLINAVDTFSQKNHVSGLSLLACRHDTLFPKIIELMCHNISLLPPLLSDLIRATEDNTTTISGLATSHPKTLAYLLSALLSAKLNLLDLADLLHQWQTDNWSGLLQVIQYKPDMMNTLAKHFLHTSAYRVLIIDMIIHCQPILSQDAYQRLTCMVKKTAPSSNQLIGLSQHLFFTTPSNKQHTLIKNPLKKYYSLPCSMRLIRNESDLKDDCPSEHQRISLV